MKKCFLLSIIMFVFILFGCDLLLEINLDSNENTINMLIPLNNPPVLSPIGNKTIIQGNTLEFTISATDIDNNPLTYSVQNIPSGATFNEDTRTFSWTNPPGGIYTVNFNVSDGHDLDSQEVTITCWEPFNPEYDIEIFGYGGADYIPEENRASCGGASDQYGGAGKVTFIMEEGTRYRAEFNISISTGIGGFGYFSIAGGMITTTYSSLQIREWTSGNCYIYAGSNGSANLTNLKFYRTPD